VAPKEKTYAAEQYRLKVTQYDRASSLLLALLITLGVLVVVLFFAWLSTIIYVPQIAVPVEMTEVGEGEGGGDGRPMGGSQLDTPSDEPFVGTDAVTEGVQESLSVLPDAIASKVAELDDPSIPPPSRHGSFGTGGGIGGGFGDGRGLGHGPGRGGIPRDWEVFFAKGKTLELYSRQLDFVHIELAIVNAAEKKVYYAKDFTHAKPTTRIGAADPKAEQRYYLRWRSGGLEQADKELLARAGIEAGNNVILKYLPPDTEGKLVALERAKAGSRAPKDIKKTRFGIKEDGGGFVFYVIEQTYKN
jgi:hypothetical protein